jgi:DNA-binding MarR family transcriptional regulator
MNELVAATAFTRGGVTRLIDRVEQAGYVERCPCPNDRRVTYVGLTERGQKLLERASAVHVRGIQEHLVDVLDAAEVAQLDAILAKVVQRGAAASSC